MGNNKQCPICGSNMSPEYNLCTSCGWISFIFPSEIPDELRAMEEVRFRAAKDAHSKTMTLQSPIAPQAQSPVPSQGKASGFIVFKNRETQEEAAALIYQGCNTYGSEAASDLHHKINMEPILFDFAPKHFSVDTQRSKGWVLKDLVGMSLKTKAGNIPREGVYVTPALGPVLINESVEFKIIKL